MDCLKYLFNKLISLITMYMPTFFLTAPIEYSLAEAAALIFRDGLTKRKYEQRRADGIKRNFDVFPPYNKIRNEFRVPFLRPKMPDGSDAMVFSDTDAFAFLQSLADWQLGRLLSLKSSEPIREKCITFANDGYDISHLIKWGCDGFTNPSEYADVGDGSQKSIFATVGVSVHLRATKKTANMILTEELWKNELVNSWHAVFPIQYSYQKENRSMYLIVMEMVDYNQNFGHTKIN